MKFFTYSHLVPTYLVTNGNTYSEQYYLTEAIRNHQENVPLHTPDINRIISRRSEHLTELNLSEVLEILAREYYELLGLIDNNQTSV
jgi:hypothetical protein